MLWMDMDKSKDPYNIAICCILTFSVVLIVYKVADLK